MSYAESNYGAAPYGSDSSFAHSPGQTIPPPVPGGSGVYYYGDENGKYPYAYGGWAGARPEILSTPGGVSAVPRPDTGVVEVTGWWPNATHLHFVRIDPDGTRRPVRGGLGVAVTGESRRNAVTNPSVETGSNGYVPGVGNPTLTRVNDTADSPAGEYYLRGTIASSGQCGITVPTSFLAETFATAGATIRLSARPTALRFEIGWTNSVGGALSATNVTFTADQVNTVVNQWARLAATVTPPAGAVTPTFKVVADGMPSGGKMELDALTFEAATTDGSFFDGDSLGAVWLGTADLSVSLLSSMVTVVDADCPLDVAVQYLVADPQLTGGYAVSNDVFLAAPGRFCWLTHPLRGLPVRCDLRSVPTLQRDIDQGVYWPIGRSNALVVSAPYRRGATGEITFNAVSFAERDTLLDLLMDGVPVLLRAPARYGYGLGRWWSMGTLTEDREQRLAYQDVMALVAQGTEVDAPSPLYSASVGA